MAKKLSKSSLAIALSKLEGFKTPKVRVEQYALDSEVAASVLWNGLYIGDIGGKVIADMGCGPGILGIGALILGASKVYFIDNDEDTLKTAKNNLKFVKSESSIAGKAVFMHKDINEFNEKVEVIIENPPFGTKVRHSDKAFLEKAVKLAEVIYSFHKSETKGFVESFFSSNNYKLTNVWDFKLPLKATLHYHKRKIHRINVSCFRATKL